jgi:hypothetical protein
MLYNDSRFSRQAKSSGRTRFPALITDRAAEMAFLRWRAEPETVRLALAVFWCGFSEVTAVLELRVAIAWWAERGRYRLVRCGDLAREMLHDAIWRLSEKYEETAQRIRDGVTAHLRRGTPRAEIEARVARYATTCDPVPPPYVLRHAIDMAIDWHDWREKRWREHDGRLAA